MPCENAAANIAIAAAVSGGGEKRKRYRIPRRPAPWILNEILADFDACIDGLDDAAIVDRLGKRQH